MSAHKPRWPVDAIEYAWKALNGTALPAALERGAEPSNTAYSLSNAYRARVVLPEALTLPEAA